MTFKEELKQMILSKDTTVHDVTRYKLSYNDTAAAYYDLIHHDCLVEYQANKALHLKQTMGEKYMTKVWLESFAEDYDIALQDMRMTIEDIKSGIDDNMSELEKALYVHDYVMSHTYYLQEGLECYKAVGPFSKGYAVCEGFSQTCIMVLRLLGLTIDYACSEELNHKWCYVKLDGEWYHFDATWDLTKMGNVVAHKFFIRNDEEFVQKPHSHVNWFTNVREKSTSNKYVNWFVHSIKGRMHYNNGLWYYVEGGKICRSKIDGSLKQTLVDGEGKVIVIDRVTDFRIEYTIGGFGRVLYLSHVSKLSDGTVGQEVEPEVEQEEDTATVTDLSDFGLWQSGFYTEDGSYKQSSARICLKDTIPCDGNKIYTLSFTDAHTILVVREINESGDVVKSTQFKKSGLIETTDGTKYLKIFMYLDAKPPITYDTYKEIFDGGYSLSIM